MTPSHLGQLPSATTTAVNSQSKANEPSPKLSKSVLSMKFMQRKETPLEDTTSAGVKRASTPNAITNESKRLKVQPSEDNLADRMEVDNALTSPTALNPSNVSVSVNTSHHHHHVQYPGRRSFGGFNKVVERQYQQFLDDQRYNKMTSGSALLATSKKEDEMIERYEELIGLPRGPNQGKRPGNSNKKHFSSSR